MSNNSLSIAHLYKQYPSTKAKAINGLNLTFEEGKISGLLGPNGAGKTTVFSIICGLIKADKGTVKVYDLDINSSLKEIKKLIGVVPQQIALYPNLSAWENLTYIGKLYHIPKTELKDRINYFLKAFDLRIHSRKSIKRYSGGMKRRANIIAGLLHQPKLLILDEPTAGVDVQSRNMIIKFLHRFNEAGNSIIYTSHLLDEAERLCDDVAILDGGQIIAQNSPDKLIAAHEGCRNLEEVFLHLTGYSVRA